MPRQDSSGQPIRTRTVTQQVGLIDQADIGPIFFTCQLNGLEVDKKYISWAAICRKVEYLVKKEHYNGYREIDYGAPIAHKGYFVVFSCPRCAHSHVGELDAETYKRVEASRKERLRASLSDSDARKRSNGGRNRDLQEVRADSGAQELLAVAGNVLEENNQQRQEAGAGAWSDENSVGAEAGRQD